MDKPLDTSNVTYHGGDWRTLKDTRQSLSVIGLDTEAYDTGVCFMIATSCGDVLGPDDVPGSFFSRKYRGANFVAYNLGYDAGALLQSLSEDLLKDLWKTGKACDPPYKYRSIPKKCLTITRGKNAVHLWDLANFYGGTLESNAVKYLNEHKLDMQTKKFSREYVQEHWDSLAEYCVRDAVLCKRLADRLIKRFEALGVYPQKLFSIAYVSYQHFRRKCAYVTVKRYWDNNREVLDMAMRSYNGGKFEVTKKGVGDYHEYDIVSAYPYEIRNLIDITWARVVRSPKYRRQAVYGFLQVKMNIPFGVNSPCVVKRGNVNCYPIGEYNRTITKTEYDYLISVGTDVTIQDAVWLHIDNRQFPYRREIDKLVALKDQYKKTGDDLDYHTIKILMNSLYGKFVQLLPNGDTWKATSCWNPIYGAIITANTRTRISKLQTEYNHIVAVHTDSVISDTPLPFGKTGSLGDLIFECSGRGLILGSGIYQIGDKVRFRGFSSRRSLFDLLGATGRYAKLAQERPFTWREVAFHNWPSDQINRFTEQDRKLDVRFDRKRLWLRDWLRWSDVEQHTVESLPLVVTPVLFE